MNVDDSDEEFKNVSSKISDLLSQNLANITNAFTNSKTRRDPVFRYSKLTKSPGKFFIRNIVVVIDYSKCCKDEEQMSPLFHNFLDNFFNRFVSDDYFCQFALVIAKDGTAEILLEFGGNLFF